MAVVKTTVEELNGTMTLQTAPGEGTRFVIELPLTLSITDALIAHVGERTFAVPQADVREVIEIDPVAVRQIEQHEIAPFRGGTLPILRLGRLFGIAGTAAPRAARVRRRRRRGRRRAWRSIGSSASGRSSCAAWPTR